MSIVKFVRSHKLQNTFNARQLGFKLCTLMPVGRDISVDVATCYRLHGPRIESR